MLFALARTINARQLAAEQLRLAGVVYAPRARRGPPCICPHVILVQDGLPVGMVLPPAAVPEPEPVGRG
ncbi:MAG: hypothetical protein KF773_41890 [Deltaproteobacteria bacterium]|nr:hypothetical protein [Deltaproteobacteria bacterium]